MTTKNSRQNLKMFLYDQCNKLLKMHSNDKITFDNIKGQYEIFLSDTMSYVLFTKGLELLYDALIYGLVYQKYEFIIDEMKKKKIYFPHDEKLFHQLRKEYCNSFNDNISNKILEILKSGIIIDVKNI